MLPNEEKLDPRVKRTRQLLTQAFMDLLAEKSLQSITVQDITGRAAVNRATFYAHFEDKYALLSYIIREDFHTALQNKLPSGAALSLGNLRLLILAVWEFLTRFHSGCHPSDKQFEPMIEAQVQTELCEFILNWIEPVYIRDGDSLTEPRITASVMSWAIFGVGMDLSRDKTAQSLERCADQVLALIAGSVLGAKAGNPMIPAT